MTNLPASIDETLKLLRSTGYIAGRDLATVAFLALKMGRPLFLEGEAGVGKTEVARALASRPRFVLADEPTANLDSRSTETLLDIMANLNQREKTTFIFSTHDPRVIDRARRILLLEDGKIVMSK